MNPLPLALFIHILAVTVWIGGMFFAYVCLRPVVAAQLAPPQRLALWEAVFGRFFSWVWLAVAAILFSGLAIFAQAGWGSAPPHWHTMLTLGLVMMLIFAHIYFASFPRLQQAVAASDWQAASAALNKIRRLVGTNLALGLLTIAIATLGKYLMN